MKKTVMTCMAIVAVLAIASSAGAITCTLDQHPGASLLVPYFQVSYDTTGALVSTGVGARDTIFTIANTSASPMIAHVAVWDRYSTMQLDFDVALTAYAVQPMRISDILGGTLPSSGSDPQIMGDVCQKANSTLNGFLRVIPLVPATPFDNINATTNYASPAFGPAFSATLIHNLRVNCAGNEDPLASGYVTVDHVNYCNLADPTLFNYYDRNAIGYENNLIGDIVFTSGFGLPTYAMSTVNLEADYTFGNAAEAVSPAGGVRTFYARYWEGNALLTNPGAVPVATGTGLCKNCSQGLVPPAPCPSVHALDCNANWDVGFGDQREPLGLKYAARWIDDGTDLTTNFRVWRSTSVSPNPDPTTGNCDNTEPIGAVAFVDQDENVFGVTNGNCVSPPSSCSTPSTQFPLETQQLNITEFTHNAAPAGWMTISLGFSSVLGATSPVDVYSQAWLDYSFEGSVALESTLVPGHALDASTCNPLGVFTQIPVTVTPVVSSIPTGIGP